MSTTIYNHLSNYNKRWIAHFGEKNAYPSANSDIIGQIKELNLFLRIVYLLSLFICEWILPILILKKPYRASILKDTDFERYLDKLANSYNPLIRSMNLITKTVQLSSLESSQYHSTNTRHPLEKLLDHSNMANEFDVVVIGSGAGGAPISKHLASKGLSVAIVDKGDFPKKSGPHSILNKYFISRGLVGNVVKSLLPILAAESIGGTTSFNLGSSLRPTKKALIKYKTLFNINLNTRAFNKYLLDAERGTKTGIPKTEDFSLSDIMFDKALNKFKYRNSIVIPKTNINTSPEIYDHDVNFKRGTDLNFLRDAIKNGAHLIKNNTVTKIVQHTEYVEITIHNMESVKILKCKHLVISAGALSTPHLIRSNKLGTKWKEAGMNLKLHPATSVLAYFPKLTENRNGIPQNIGYRSSKTPNIFMLGGYVSKDLIGLAYPLDGKKLKRWMDRYNHLLVYGLLVNDRNCGRIRWIRNYPLINYKLHEKDVLDIFEGLKFISKMYLEVGAKKILLPIAGSNNIIEDIKDFDKIDYKNLSKRLYTTAFHPMGTAGISKVVDSNLLLMGTSRISVCDASVLPDSPGVNPQLTIMALSLRLADNLIDKLSL